MKFFHLADIHLGAEPDFGYSWSGTRKKELSDTFREVLESAEQQEIDIILISGDLFHRQPLLRELREVNYLFSKLSRAKVVLIAGNHDYISLNSSYRKMEWARNVYFLADENCQSVFLPEINTEIYGFSYHQKEIREAKYDDLRPSDTNRINLLLAHGGDEKHIPIHKEKLQKSGFDYIALGHIHKPCKVSGDFMIYAGALEPIDKNDIGAHGYIKGEIDKEKGIHNVLWMIAAKREYKLLDIRCSRTIGNYQLQETVQKLIEENGNRHLYKIRLTGFREQDMIYETENLLNLGNIVEITDETQPEYQFEELSRQYKNHLIGRFIDSFYEEKQEEVRNEETRNIETKNTIERQALYYGVKAMLEALR